MDIEQRILVVAAHPDDEVIGCGGTIAKYRSMGIPVRVIFLAEGVTSRYEESELQMPHVIDAQKRRNENAFKALDVLMVPKKEIFVDKRFCCRLDQVQQLELVKQIEFHISDWMPTCLFTHAPYDTNIDHRITYSAVLAASRPIASCSIKSIYSFEVLSSTEWNPAKPFQANVFIDIADFIDLKVKALSAYEGEMRTSPHPRSEQVIRSLARFRGAQAGLDFAEAFNLVRLIKI